MADKTVERTAPTSGNTVEDVPPLTNGKSHGKGEERVSPMPAAAGAPKNEEHDGTEEHNETKKSPFDQYYSQLIHQQNMLQDSVRVTAYQRAICENAADFKVRMARTGHLFIYLVDLVRVCLVILECFYSFLPLLLLWRNETVSHSIIMCFVCCSY